VGATSSWTAWSDEHLPSTQVEVVDVLVHDPLMQVVEVEMDVPTD
jgi:hypothetical protein